MSLLITRCRTLNGGMAKILGFTAFVILAVSTAGIEGFISREKIWNNTFRDVVTAHYKIVLSKDHPRDYIASPGFPYENYPPDTQVTYEVEISGVDDIKQYSNRILMTFDMFVLQESVFCTKDGLEILDSSNQARVYCGSQVGRTVLSEDSKLQIRFFSDSSIESRGYGIHLQMYNTGCSQLFTDVDTGTISSPNFPGRYLPDDLCVWKIQAPEGKRISVKFEETFDIRAYEPLCVQDYLAVSLTGDFETHIKRYCHSTRPDALYSEGNTLLLKFRTDCCFEGKGFSASFTVIDEDEITPTEQPKPKDQMCECGEENEGEGERIMGGKVVEPPNRYPWVVALVKVKNDVQDYFCGGVLINKQYVLTASHCIEKESVTGVRVALGAHNVDTDPNPVRVSEFKIHPKYTNRTYLNDIALLKLQDPVDFGKTVRAVCLPTRKGFTSPKDVAIVAGWGLERFLGHNSGSKELKEVDVPIVSNAQCESVFGGVIVDTSLCAGGEGGKDSCSGDSGGPLFSKYDDKWYSVGIVSWGLTCGMKDYPAVYTRVSEYLDWIADETADSPSCDDEEKITPPVKPNLDDCGLPNQSIEESERIVGGDETKPFEYPWMALIVYDKRVAGAGALINPYYVITAASVFDAWVQWYPDILDVFLGRHRLSKGDARSRRYGVQAVYIHPQYGKPSPYNNDVALLKLKVSEGGLPKIYRPICLPRSDAWYPPDLSLTTAGWGRTSTKGTGSDVLLKVDLFVWSEEKCEKRYSGWFTDKMICASKYGSDTCEGDSGAPLMRPYYGRYYLAGLSSFASKDGCAVHGAPRVFSAVHQNLRWISDRTGLSVA